MLTGEDKKWFKSTVAGSVREVFKELLIPRFEKIDKRLDILEEKVTNLENLIERILNTSRKIHDQLDHHEKRVRHLETANA